MRTEQQYLDSLFPPLKGLAALLDVLVDSVTDGLRLFLLLDPAGAVVGSLIGWGLESLAEGVVCIAGCEEGGRGHV